MSGFLETFNEDEEDTKGLLGDGDDRNATAKRLIRSSSKIKGIRSGQIVIFLKTVLICCIFYAMGFTSSIVEKTPTIKNIQFSPDSLPSSLPPPASTPPTVAHGLGYILGFVLGGFFLSRLNRQFLLFLSLVTMASFLSVVPFAHKVWLANSTFGTLGVTKAFLVLGGNVICLDFWGSSSGPYIHAIYFSMSLGLFSGDTIIKPLINTLDITDTDNNMSLHLSNLTRHKRSQAVQVDPILLKIFDKKQTEHKDDLEPAIKVKKPKPKPTFTDGRKLDNSRDWERVKIAKPDPIPLLPKYSTVTITPTTSTTTESSFDSNTIEDILADLNKDQTKKRIKRKIKSNSFYRRRENDEEGFEDNRLYSKKHSTIDDDLTFEANRNAFYDSVIPVNPNPYYENDYEMPPPKVENAIEVIEQYFGEKANKSNSSDQKINDNMPTSKYPQRNFQSNISPEQTDFYPSKNKILQIPSKLSSSNALDEQSDLAPSQKKQLAPNLDIKQTKTNILEPENSSTTRKVENEATTSQTTLSEETTIIQQETQNSRKPTRTFDQDSEPSRLKAVLDRYGFSGEDVAYMSASIYIFLIAAIMLCCLCHNPREPRSRQDDGILGEVKHENKIFKCSMLCLMFLFSLLHSGMLTALYQVAPRVLPPSYIPVRKLCLGMITSTRFLGAVAVIISSPGLVLSSSMLMSLSGCLLMVVEVGSVWRVWAAFAMQCIGQAALLPASIAWCESYIYISNYAMASILTGVGIGELITPHMLSLISTDDATLINIHSAIKTPMNTDESSEAAWIWLVMLGAMIHLVVVALAMWLMARKRGNKYSRPEAGGYQRANTDDDILEQLVEEEEDFEMSEAKYGVEDEVLVNT